MTAPGASHGTADGRSPVNSLADEAAQLLDALAVRLAQVRVTVGDHVPAGRPSGVDVSRERAVATETGSKASEPNDVPEPDEVPEPATGHLQCVGWCPVCRSADLLRGDRSEVAGKLVDSAIVVVAALRSLLPGTAAAGTPAAGPSAPDPSSSWPSTSDAAASEQAASRPSAAGQATGQPGGPPPPPPGIERIDIR